MLKKQENSAIENRSVKLISNSLKTFSLFFFFFAFSLVFAFLILVQKIDEWSLLSVETPTFLQVLFDKESSIIGFVF